MGEPFPDNRYISIADCVIPRINPHAFDIVMTLNNLTAEELKAIGQDKFYVSIFVHKQIPHIVFNFGIYKFNVSINIQKINSVPRQMWVYDDEPMISLFLLEPGSGNIINIRTLEFPIMKELKYLLRLQLPLSKEEIDLRAQEAENIYSIPEMIKYSIFFGEVEASRINL